MSIMLDYLRNKNDVLRTQNIQNASAQKIGEEVKKAFKYTQTVLREDFELTRMKKKKTKEEILKRQQSTSVKGSDFKIP